jgi:uncharacterized protein (DUF433 family)
MMEQRKMGKVTDKIRLIMLQENLSLQEVFEKYPHLADLQKEEMFEEYEQLKETKVKKDLLKG